MKDVLKQRGFEIAVEDDSVLLRVSGKTLEDLFRNAVRGVAAYLKASALDNPPESAGAFELDVEAVDINSLLIEMLSRVLAESDIRSAVFIDVTFKTFGENFLTADLREVPVADFDHEIAAVSYQDVDIRKNASNGNFEASLMLNV